MELRATSLVRSIAVSHALENASSFPRQRYAVSREISALSQARDTLGSPFNDTRKRSLASLCSFALSFAFTPTFPYAYILVRLQDFHTCHFFVRWIIIHTIRLQVVLPQ